MYVTGQRQKKFTSRHPTCLTNSDHDYILEENVRRDKIEFKRYVEVYSDDGEN